MTDLRELISNLYQEIRISDTKDMQHIVAFLEDNSWFDNMPIIIDGKVMLTDEQLKIYKMPLQRYLYSYNHNPDSKVLLKMLSSKYNITATKLEEFFNIVNASEESRFYIADFLLYSLDREAFMMDDKQMSILVKKAVDDLIKAHGEMLTFYFSWLKANYKTRYQEEYVMKNRFSMEYRKEAYDFDEYLELLYYLFNEDYFNDNEMYLKASKSKNYADTWLFLVIHFICSLRMTDLERIFHPLLSKEPEVILKEIGDGIFTDKDAREVLNSITYRLCLLPLTPNKSSSHNNISSIKFTVPESCEVHFGKLFALCEAHRLLAGVTSEEPLIRKISDFDRISRYMGDEIGLLFLESNFRSRSANKSYLQAVYMLADDILENDNDGPSVKGYILAALARSHKGAYGEFAKTTAVYLKDAKFSGLTPEFVAMELFERGVLSFIPSMLLKIITNGEYSKLTVSNQTRLIQTLGMTPAEIENTVAITDRARKKSENVIKELLSSDASEDTILDILHRIGSGSAFSKQPENLCLLSAKRMVCPYNKRKQCVGCDYEIATKSTLFLMVSEYNRLTALYNSVDNSMEKVKYKNLLTQVVIPEFDELLVCIREQYGEEVYNDYEMIIKENIV